jgi:glycopeptide antibiotics resistance protein
MPEQFISPVLALIAISMLMWILFWMVFSNAKKREGVIISFQAEITFFVFYIYIIAVMSLTIIPLPFARFEEPGESGINLTPVINIIKAILEGLSPREDLSEHSFQNLAGNIILFIPLGIFLPLLSVRYRSIYKVVITAALCSALIESVQLILRQFQIYRTVDIDDIILNTIGAATGFVLVNKLYFTKPI